MKICEVCKKQYENVVHNQRFCSPECNKKAKLCMCGCGEYATRYFKYKSGHHLIGTSYMSDTGRKAASDRMKANNPAKWESTRLKISNTLKRKYKSNEIVKPPLTEKHKQSISERMKTNNPMHNKKTAKKVGLKMKGRFAGNKNPNWKERKIVICKGCKKEMFLTPSDKRLFCSKDCWKRFKKTTAGKLEHNWWLGGKSFEPYPPEFDKNIKKKIKNRDGYRCQLCRRKKPNHRLHVHHIDYNKKNNKKNNLVVLCEKCHSKTNYNRESWIPILKKRISCL